MKSYIHNYMWLCLQDGKLTQVARPNPPNFGTGFVSKINLNFASSVLELLDRTRTIEMCECVLMVSGLLIKAFFLFQIMLRGLNMKNGSRRLSNYFKCSRSFWKRRLELTGSRRKPCLPNREQQKRQGESSLRKMLSSSNMLQSSKVLCRNNWSR